MILNENEILVLQACESDITSFEVDSIITSSNWNPEPVFDGGLYGLPWGEGSIEHLLNFDDTIWMLLVVDTSNDYVYNVGEIKNKCKFKSGRICYIGDCVGATELLQKYAPKNTKIMYVCQTGESNAVQIAWCGSTQTAENYSNQKAGNESTQTARHYSTQKARINAFQKAGHESTQIAEDYSTQKAGYKSTQQAGIGSTQKASAKSIQTSGDGSIQTAGTKSIQKTGCFSTQIVISQSYQRAGIGSVQISHWWDENELKTSYRVITEVEAGIWYYVEDGVWTTKDPPKE